jgi:hypothetical protein
MRAKIPDQHFPRVNRMCKANSLGSLFDRYWIKFVGLGLEEEKSSTLQGQVSGAGTQSNALGHCGSLQFDMELEGDEVIDK